MKLWKLTVLGTNLLVNAQQVNRDVSALWFDAEFCRAPESRNGVQNTPLRSIVPANEDVDPKLAVCEFCDEKLHSVVNEICCSSYARKRRSTETTEFWQNAPHSAPDSERKTFEFKDCAASKSRQKRENGGPKIASTIDEILDIHKCPETLDQERAASFLKSVHEKYEGTDDDMLMRSGGRKKRKHTFLVKECCGTEQDCDMNEIHESHLSEECCNEGCRIEEIVEMCGTWRWDYKDNKKDTNPFLN